MVRAVREYCHSPTTGWFGECTAIKRIPLSRRFINPQVVDASPRPRSSRDSNSIFVIRVDSIRFGVIEIN